MSLRERITTHNVTGIMVHGLGFCIVAVSVTTINWASHTKVNASAIIYASASSALKLSHDHSYTCMNGPNNCSICMASVWQGEQTTVHSFDRKQV